MKQILIKFPEGITDEQAVELVTRVIRFGRISDNGTHYCCATTFQKERLIVYSSERTKYPTFTIMSYDKI